MPNRETEEAERFHQATDMPRPEAAQERPAFKSYPTLEPISLPQDFPAPEADTLEAVAGQCCEENAPDLRGLSQILFFSTDLSRKNKFPIEIYAVAATLDGLEPGIYHFSPEGFTLTRLRFGDFRPELAGAAGDNQAIAGAPVTLVLSAHLWRSPGARSYKDLFWNCGAILADLLATATSLEIPASVEMGFVDSKVDYLLGLDGERETSLCLVPLGRTLDWAMHAVLRAIPPLTYPVAPPPGELDSPEIRSFHAASRLVSDDEVRPWRSPCPRKGEGLKNTLFPAVKPVRSGPLGTAILRRGPAQGFSASAVGSDQLAAILVASTRGIPADFLEGPETSLIDLYAIGSSVEGLEPGAYYFSPVQKKLELLRRGSFQREIAASPRESESARAFVFLVCALDHALERFGNRGYRAALLEAGVTGGKINLGAASLGLAASRAEFDHDAVHRLLDPHAAGKKALFGIALGEDKTVNRQPSNA